MYTQAFPHLSGISGTSYNLSRDLFHLPSFLQEILLGQQLPFLMVSFETIKGMHLSALGQQ